MIICQMFVLLILELSPILTKIRKCGINVNYPFKIIIRGKRCGMNDNTTALNI